MVTCKICGGEMSVAYEGNIRDGVFGRYTTATIYGCPDCGAEYLPPKVSDVADFYESERYRQTVGEEADAEDYFRKHDDEQFPKMALLEGLGLRGKVVADVGCGGGSFLDGVKGFAGTTIGIEPTAAYHDSLRQRGHRTYGDTDKALGDWKGQVDLVVSFSVIEHVEDPVGFLNGIRSLLKDDGVCLISTPNRGDVLLQLDQRYREFFYRTVHTFYFDAESFRRMAETAGMQVDQVQYVQRFNFSNFVEWLRQGRPTGNKQVSPLGAGFDPVWRSLLEVAGLADYLYVFLRR